MHFQFRVPEPMPKFDYLSSISIINVLPRAKDLDCGEAGIPDPFEPNGRQAVPHKQMRGNYLVHEFVFLSVSLAE